MLRKAIFFFIFICKLVAFSQSPRLSLFEEFTGENCPPCALVNPGLDALLSQSTNPLKIVAIKWMVPIQSAPSNTWSLYQSNKAEIDWRSGPSGTAYGYPVKWTATSPQTNGITSAPTGLIDGQDLWKFGTASNNAGLLSNSAINTAQTFTSAFSINIARSWNANYSAITLTVSIQATANYTANGNLVFRLVMIEQQIHFATQPGSNGEKKFENVVRQSFPNIQTGTPMAPTWTVGQTQTFTLNATIPANVLNLAEVALVGFIQNDGNKKIEQTFLSDAVGQNNDAKALETLIPDVVCSSTLAPLISIKNHGDNIINTLTVSPSINGVPQAPFAWSGSLSPGSITNITLNTYSISSGAHTFSYTISSVNGASDSYTANNFNSISFLNAPSYFTVPISESFSVAAFPPANWAVINKDNGTFSWSRVANVGAYGKNNGAIKYDFYNNTKPGDEDDLYLPPIDLSGIVSPNLSFDRAYAEYPGGYNDKLEILVSDNCGANWTNIYSKAASSLSTAPATTGSFVPTANEWRNEVISLASFTSTAKILIKFKTFNANGNNLWLDNINVGLSYSDVGLKKEKVADILVDIFPNPAKKTTQIAIHSTVKTEAIISVVNVLGEQVYSNKSEINIGKQNILLDLEHLPKGVYFVLLDSEKASFVKKLLVDE